jgi:hypothetical protein
MNLSTFISFIVLLFFTSAVYAANTGYVEDPKPSVPVSVWVPILVVGLVVLFIITIVITVVLTRLLCGMKIVSDKDLEKPLLFSKPVVNEYMQVGPYANVDADDEDTVVEEVKPEKNNKLKEELMILRAELDTVSRSVTAKKTELRLAKDRLVFKEKDAKYIKQNEQYNKVKETLLALRVEEREPNLDDVSREKIIKKRESVEEEFFALPHDEIDLFERLRGRAEQSEAALNSLLEKQQQLEKQVKELEAKINDQRM